MISVPPRLFSWNPPPHATVLRVWLRRTFCILGLGAQDRALRGAASSGLSCAWGFGWLASVLHFGVPLWVVFTFHEVSAAASLLATTM